MNILFLSAQYPPDSKGGGEISTHLIARGLIAIGHTVQVVTSRDRAQDYEQDGVPVRALPLGLRGKPLFERMQSRRATKILRANIPDLDTYDIIHAHDFRSALMLSELNMPQAVVTARDYAQISGCTNNIQYSGNIDPGCQGTGEFWRCHRVHEASLARRPFRIWQYVFNRKYRREAFRSFRHQIFISHTQKEYIKKFQDISRQHTGVIYNPIDQEYVSTPIEKGLEGNVLYIGRVEMYKGVKLLLQAWRNVARQVPNARLTIVGNGAQYKEYERLAATWGLHYQVSFQQHVPYHRLRGMIDESEVVVSPHVWVEPFGRGVVEGMARGKTVIAANIGGPAEIIQSGKTGMLFERGSKGDLEKALIDALAMNRFDKKEIGTAAQKFVRDNLTMEKIAKIHEEFYKEVVG